jgi:hypothetical protein
MKLKNRYNTFKFVEYDDQYNLILITNSYPNYESPDIYLIGDSENFPLKLNIHSQKFLNLIDRKYFLNLP